MIQYARRESDLNCPICGRQMTAFNYRAYNLELDACLNEHGFWLDEGESAHVREIMVDEADNILVASFSRSADFPITAGAQQTEIGGMQDAVVLSLNTTCSDLQWSTFIGGSNNDGAFGLRVSDGNVVICGQTFSTADWVFSTIAVLLAIEFTRRTTGLIIPIMILVALSYVAWWGKYVEGVFRFPGLTWETVLYRSYYGLDGMFGPIAHISSTYVYMFVLFGKGAVDDVEYPLEAAIGDDVERSELFETVHALSTELHALTEQLERDVERWAELAELA